ncbi:hypothetical protein [Vampirovibrio sp.]|uniref:hypothetical protein n=1 Tax=Vampirovibrio sp. TaxID=2717857 RepID=UPI00359473C4
MIITGITPLVRPTPSPVFQKDKPLFQGHQAENKDTTLSKAQAQALSAWLLQQDQTETALLNHDLPRGSAKLPGMIQSAGQKVSEMTVAVDFLPHTLHSAASSVASWTRGKWSPSSLAENQTEALSKHREAEAARLVAAVHQQLPLNHLYDLEEGVDPLETKRLLIQALRDEPKLFSVVHNALSHPVAAAVKWPIMAKPPLKATILQILNWQQERESSTPAPAPPSEVEMRSQSATHLAGSSTVPEKASSLSTEDEIQPNPEPAQTEQPQTETTPSALSVPPPQTGPELARKLQAAAALSARGGKQMASSLRQFERFQQKPLTETELSTRYLQKNQYPPLKNPYELMVLDPETSTIQVSNRLPEPAATNTAPKPWWRGLVPDPKKVILKHDLPIKITSKDPNAPLLIAALIKNQPLPPIQPNTTVALRLRDEKKFKEDVFRPILNTFRISEEIEIKDPNHPGQFKKVQLKEACLWPFLEAVLLKGEEGLGPNCKVKGSQKACFDLLADADIYQFTSSDPALAKLLNERLNHREDPKLRSLKAKLAAIQLAGLQYAEQVDVLDTVTTFSKGFAAGIAGEQIASRIGGEATPGESVWKTPGLWIRLAFLSMVDAVDNWYGEHGVLEADLKGMGLSNSTEHVFGDQPPANPVEARHYLSARHATHLPGWLESLRRRVLLMGSGDADGKASQAVASTYRSIALGGMGGVAMSLYAAKTFTEQQPGLANQMLSTSVGTLGAFSIPINFGLTLPRVMSSFNEHLEEGRLLLPKHIKPTDQKAVRAYVKEMALQEMMARTGLQASLKSYTVIPALGLVWPAQLFIPRDVLQSMLAPFMPVAENLTRMGLMLHRVEGSFSKSLADTEGMVLSAYLNDEPHMDRYQHQIRGAFNGAWSRLAAQGMNVLTYPLQLSMTHRKQIDFHDGPEPAKA